MHHAKSPYFWIAAAVSTLLFSQAAYAEDQTSRPMGERQYHYRLLSGLLTSAALNGALATRSFALATSGYKWLNVKISFTKANNGTLTLLCDSVTSDTVATNTHYTRTTCATAAGACTLSWDVGATTPTLTASKDFSVLVKVEGHAYTECSITHNGAPAAGDTVSVTGELIAE